MEGANCVIFLIDESSAMANSMREKRPDGTESTKTNAERVATSLNGLLRQLADGPPCEIALIGYRSNEEGQPAVGSRWPGTLAARDFVRSDELFSAAKVESRTKRVARADGAFDETTSDFAVWYEPTLGGRAPQVAAFQYCCELIGRWRESQSANLSRPLVVHVFSGDSVDGSPQMMIEQLMRLEGAGGKPLVLNCHMAASSVLVTTAFPSRQAYLSSSIARDLFSRASELTGDMRDALKAARIAVQPTARALVHNAKMIDLYRCLELVKCHIAGDQGTSGVANAEKQGASPNVTVPTHPSTTAESGHAGKAVGLAVLVLDRSVADPCNATALNPCARLEEAANEILKQLSTKGALDLAIDTAIVSYGSAQNDQGISTTFDGPLTGRTIVRNTDLPNGAIRVEESELQIPNGVGGLITITKKTPIYFDVKPAGAMPPQQAFAAAATIVSDWLAQHQSGIQPIVLHLTRGEAEARDLEAAVAIVRNLGTSGRSPLVHHLILTESPCKSYAYPPTAEDLASDSLRTLWNCSSRLAGWESLAAAKRPHITGESRGFVVNAKFDVLAEELANVLMTT